MISLSNNSSDSFTSFCNQTYKSFFLYGIKKKRGTATTSNQGIAKRQRNKVVQTSPLFWTGPAITVRFLIHILSPDFLLSFQPLQFPTIPQQY